ncbi:MAG TPA: hypothetical protein VFU15_08730 [Bacteroidia bacterium]|nr:hypothetical protein [Bacteroidia bacterium]
MLKRLSLLLLFFIPLLSQAQNDSAIDVPAQLAGKNYSERTFFKDGHLTHQVCYNDPGPADEEFCYTLDLDFASFDSISDRHGYDLVKDTAFVRCSFGVISPQNRDMDPKAVITGNVFVLGKSKDSIAVLEDIRVTDSAGQVYIYHTQRSFERKKEK